MGLLHDHRVHGAFVDRWLATTAGRAGSSPQLVALFAAALDALWTRAHVTLGEVTLTAIVDRVVYDAAERLPLVTAVDVGTGGLRFDRLAAQADGLDRDEVLTTMRSVLTELLTVIGSLTAEILTPALHAALSTVQPASGAATARDEHEDRRS